MKWKLKELIEKNNDTMEQLAKYLKITYQTLSRKLNGHVEFTRAELKMIKVRYKLNAEQMDIIFLSEEQ